MKNEITDSFLNKIFKDDELNCKPNQEIKSRLDYAFMLKGSQGRIRQNSFLELFTWFFSGRNMFIKTAFVSAIILLSVLNFQQKPDNFDTSGVDTAAVQTIPLDIDSIIDHSFKDDSVLTQESSRIKGILSEEQPSLIFQSFQDYSLCKLTPRIKENSFDHFRDKTREEYQIYWNKKRLVSEIGANCRTA